MTRKTTYLLAIATALGGCSADVAQRASPQTEDPAAPASQGAVDRERGGPTEVSVRWDEVENGMRRESAQSLALEVVDNTGEGRAFRLVTTASGLSGRLIQRPLSEVTLGAGERKRVALKVADLPMQSAEAASFVSVMVELDRPDGTTVRVPTAPLYYLFDEDYGAATFYDQHGVAVAPEVADALVDPMKVHGRLLNADGIWSEVVGSEDGIQGSTVVTASDPADLMQETDRDELQPRNPAVNGPAIDDPSLGAVVEKAAGAHVCSTWRVQYIDSGYGEDSWPTNQWQDVPAAFAKASIYSSAGGLMWNGNLDAGGCIDVVLPSGTYRLKQDTFTTRWANITFQTYYKTSGGSAANSIVETSFSSNGTAGQSIPLKPTVTGDDLQAGAVAGLVLVQHGLGLFYGLGGMGIADGTYSIAANTNCDGPTLPKTDSCYDPNQNRVKIGTTVINGYVESHWKFIIAHEIGHNVQYIAMGSVTNNYDDNSATQPACRCDHYNFATWGNQAHCLQSREFLGAAQIEGFAQGFASRTFNQTHVTGARMVYYKPFRYSDGTVGYPPLSSFPDLYSKWMETNCGNSATDKGVELDWMQFYYKSSAEYSANYTSFKKLFDIYMRACGPTGSPRKCTSGNSVTWTSFLTAAQGYYGGSATNPAYVRLRDTGVNAGVDN